MLQFFNISKGGFGKRFRPEGPAAWNSAPLTGNIVVSYVGFNGVIVAKFEG